MDNFENIIMSVCVFGSGVLVVFIIARYNYLIKKALAEKGITVRPMKINYSEIACIVMGIALGLGFASIFTTLRLAEDTADLLIWSVILIGGGGGLWGAHFMRKRNGREE